MSYHTKYEGENYYRVDLWIWFFVVTGGIGTCIFFARRKRHRECLERKQLLVEKQFEEDFMETIDIHID